MGRDISWYNFDRICQFFYILKFPYNVSQFCVLVKPEILDCTGGKAVSTQIQNEKKYIYIYTKMEREISRERSNAKANGQNFSTNG